LDELAQKVKSTSNHHLESKLIKSEDLIDVISSVTDCNRSTIDSLTAVRLSSLLREKLNMTVPPSLLITSNSADILHQLTNNNNDNNNDNQDENTQNNIQNNNDTTIHHSEAEQINDERNDTNEKERSDTRNESTESTAKWLANQLNTLTNDNHRSRTIDVFSYVVTISLLLL
jgi:hypothetical protein